MSLKERVKELREQGKTYKEITKELGIAKSTVSYYCRVIFGPPIPKKQYFCECGNKKDKRSKRCKDCIRKDNMNKTIISGNSKLGDKVYDDHKYAKYSYIRYHAKKILDSENVSSCMNCGYSKHIETAHIKKISSFSEDTLISEINSRENLLALCPNCHWEFDFGDLTLEQIKSPRQDSHL